MPYRLNFHIIYTLNLTHYVHMYPICIYTCLYIIYMYRCIQLCLWCMYVHMCTYFRVEKAFKYHLS